MTDLAPARAGRPAQLRLDVRKRNGGFALVIVIWGMGVIALLLITVMTTARSRLQTASNISGAAQAGFVADSAINAAILQLLAEKSGGGASDENPVHDGRPRFCLLAGAAVALAVEDEGGKIDLNSAAPELLQMMLEGLGIAQQRAETLTQAIGAFNSAPGSEVAATATIPTASSPPPGPLQARFTTVFELDQVAGVEPPLFRRLLPFVTVHSGHSGLNTETAPPALFAAVAGYSADTVTETMTRPFPNRLDRTDPRIPPQFKQSGQNSAFLIHAEAILPAGQMSTREAIVELGANQTAGFTIRELRRGAARNLDDLSAAVRNDAEPLPSCL